MVKKIRNYYTLGRVVSTPAAHVGKEEKIYQTVYIELFGGMKVSALAGVLELTKGMYVGVKITPKKDGQATYNVFPFNADAEEMIIGAASYIDAPARAEYDEELPF